ncbi:MAG TPA: CbiM family transporter [Gemmataceae bacterium]|jgi:cobalt/nickel transport system permease protein
MVSLWLPWAVHISDGVLENPWLAGGFVVAGLLALLASYRVREEEIPRIALLSAAFFVASLMHLPVGPTSVHLLLNGLVGVVLGRRAPLAILIGLGLQAALLGHGGFSTVGINACVMTLPALLAGWMFAALHRLPWIRQKNRALIWASGCVIGMTAVLATLVLNAAVLLWGGAEDWFQIVWLVFFAHLPLVALEGVVLGFTVSFLARVKPEMLGMSDEALRKWRMPEPINGTPKESDITPPPTDVTPAVSSAPDTVQPPLPSRPLVLLAVVLTALLAAGPARAHRLKAACTVLPNRQVRIESWFDLGGVPKGATVQVFRPGQRLLVEGQLDENGFFVFHYPQAEKLDVIVSAGAGHRNNFVIAAEQLEAPDDPAPPREPTSPPETPATFRATDAGDAWRERLKEALIGVSFLLAVGAFLLSWRNARKLQSLQQTNPTDPPRDP